MPLDFPSNPANGDVYTDGTTGNRYVWVNSYSYWSYQAANIVGSATNTNILFSDSGVANGTAGLTFNKTTNTVFLGNSTANAVWTVTLLALTNSTANINLTIPTAAQITNGNYFLNANGVWSLVSAAPGGANTNVLFNDSGSANSTAGFTFNKATNNAFIANSLVVGANAVHNVSSFTIVGNTTTAPTTTLTGTGLTAGNTSITGAPQIIIANSAGNTTINTTSILVGSNAVHNLSSFTIVGNTTTAPTVTHSGTGITAGNTSITGAPQLIVANSAGTTTINTNFISTTSISGNLTGNVTATSISGNLTGNVSATTISGNLTGNVSAITITGNLTGNVAATTIAGNLTGNVAAITITGNLTGNVVATTISGNLTGNVSATTVSATGNVTVGANVFMNLTSHVVLGNTTTAPTVTLTGTGLTAGNTSITGAPQIIIANSAGNTTINTTSVVVGSNAVHNLSAFSITGNTTTAPTATLQGANLQIGNTTVTGAPQLIVANSAGTTTINTNFISTTSISGNLTGNVTATTGTFGSVIVANGTGLYVNSTAIDLYMNSSAGIWANGSFGTAADVLTSNGSAVYWAASAAGVNVNATYAWTNTHTFTGNVTVGNTTSNSSFLTSFFGTRNPDTFTFGSITTQANYNSVIAGPYTIAAGNTLTIATGSRVVIV